MNLLDMPEKIEKKTYKPSFSRKKFMLLGIRESGEKVWLEQGSWDCNWYYGFGYLEEYKEGRNDIEAHFHVDGYKEQGKALPEAICKDFMHITLTERELWDFCELMETFYRLKDAYELYYRGTSGIIGDNGIGKNFSIADTMKDDQRKIILATQRLMGMPEKLNTIIKG